METQWRCRSWCEHMWSIWKKNLAWPLSASLWWGYTQLWHEGSPYLQNQYFTVLHKQVNVRLAWSVLYGGRGQLVGAWCGTALCLAASTCSCCSRIALSLPTPLAQQTSASITVEWIKHEVTEMYLQAIVDVTVRLFLIVLGLSHRASVCLKNIT